jgi:hypothetical protein
MPPKLRQYVNRTILMSIPALFEDGQCRPHTLRSIETDGLWISSDELTDRLLPKTDRHAMHSPQLVFVPAAQIAAIILPAARPPDDATETLPMTMAKPATAKRRKTAAPAADATATSTK